MPLSIHPVTPPDIPTLTTIEFAAYANSPSSQILRGRDTSNKDHHKRAHRRYTDLLTSPNHRFYKIVDAERIDSPVTRALCGEEEIVGFYRYEIFPEGIPPGSPLDYALEEHPWRSEFEAVVREYWSTMERDKRACIGTRPHIHLHLITIHPSHQRRGVGTLLLEHFIDELDRLGDLPAFCQASVEGRGLYERFGFVALKASEFCTEGIGVPGRRVLWNMVREPRRGNEVGVD